MALTVGKFTYSDTTTQIRSVVPIFDLLSPKEVPFLKRISGGDVDKPSLNSLSAPCTASKYEWIEDIDPPVKTTLLANTLIGDLTLGVAAAQTLYIVENMILLIGTEQLMVTANDNLSTATSITVTHAWGGTTAAGHTLGDVVYIVGRAHREGQDAPQDSYMYPTMPYNYVQEFTAGIVLSEMEQAIKRYGIDNAVEYETAKKARLEFIMMERQCFYGKRVLGAAGTAGAFGGLETYIPAANTTDLSAAALATADISNMLQKIYDTVGQVGMPNTIVCGSWARRKLSTIYSTTSVTTYRDQESRTGGVRVDTINTEFTDLDILLTPWCNPANVYFLNIDKIGIGPLEGQEFRREMLAKTGTSDKWMITGEYTLEVRASANHGLIKNISTTT